MRDESATQQQLSALWPANPRTVRESCEIEAAAGAIQSYVDLLTCLQMADWDKPASRPAPKEARCLALVPPGATNSLAGKDERHVLEFQFRKTLGALVHRLDVETRALE